MLCGSKCFLIEMERNGVTETKQVIARTPIGARKVIRGKYGAKVRILSAKEDQRKR